MQLRAAELEAHLAKTLAPAYAIHGDEPLLALEAADAVRAAARKQGFAQREVFEPTRYFVSNLGPKRPLLSKRPNARPTGSLATSISRSPRSCLPRARSSVSEQKPQAGGSPFSFPLSAWRTRPTARSARDSSGSGSVSP